MQSSAKVSLPALPVLETRRLTLRQIEESDAEGLHAAMGDPEVMRLVDLSASRDVAETAFRIRQSGAIDVRWVGTWAILARSGGFAGMIGYHHREPWNRRLELAWILAPAFWRQGIMTEAGRIVLQHCFAGMDAHRVEAMIHPENIRARGLAAKLGFTLECGLLRDRLCVNGQFRSVLLYSLLQSEWPA
jgi:[ribosomal protein S5]-alanine N-acetyltransferase